MTYYSCVLVACTVCREAQHRHAYESSYVGGTFPDRAAAPDKLLRECIQEDEGEMRGDWDPKKGGWQYVDKVTITICLCTNGLYFSLATVQGHYCDVSVVMDGLRPSLLWGT
jgi:hypothetical protein